MAKLVACLVPAQNVSISKLLDDPSYAVRRALGGLASEIAVLWHPPHTQLHDAGFTAGEVFFDPGERALIEAICDRWNPMRKCSAEVEVQLRQAESAANAFRGFATTIGEILLRVSADLCEETLKTMIGRSHRKVEARDWALAWMFQRQFEVATDRPDSGVMLPDAFGRLVECIDTLLAETAAPHAVMFPAIKPQADAEPLKVYLHNWRQILDTLELHNERTNRNHIRKLNDKCGGPILLPSQGGQPRVVEAELLSWWRRIEELWKEKKEQGDLRQQTEGSRRETVSDQHSYGHEGIVVPAIGGSIKRRRKKPKTS